VNKKAIVIGAVLLLALGGGVAYRLTHTESGGAGHAEHKEAPHQEEAGHKEAGHKEDGHKDPGHGAKEGHDGHGGEQLIKLTLKQQKENGVSVSPARSRRLAGSIGATGKVEVNADRIAHVSPRISGKLVTVHSSLGDTVAAGQVLALLDSVELGEALNRYRQSKTRLALAKANMDRITTLVQKKIVARKEIQQAESDLQTAQAELHSDEERLSLYGLAPADLAKGLKRPLLPVRSPIGGIVTEKHAIVGELGDPAKSLYTVADLSTVWVMVDVHEKDLAKVRRGQEATVLVAAFPETRFRGRVTHLADQLNEASRTVKARVEVANPGRRLKPEMFASVDLALAADTPPVVAVPEAAVQEVNGKKVVFVAESDTEFEPREVQLGRASGGMVELLSGLKEGERYAEKGGFLLKSELKKGEIEGHAH
jgi:cobalt-zinc-cadmium efflux system membrane fusion protein